MKLRARLAAACNRRGDRGNQIELCIYFDFRGLFRTVKKMSGNCPEGW
jgi:hypothetical protein